MKRWLLRIGIVLLALALALGLSLAWISEPVPKGVQGSAADDLARSIQAAVNLDAWNRTGAVAWTFAGRTHHEWDRLRHYDHVRWDEVEVMLDLDRRVGCAWVDAAEVREADALRERLDQAYAKWVNDSFWLNPIGKFFDPGVERSLGEQDGERSLLVHFTKNGLTPGDSYLWRVGEGARPKAWRMWTRIPVGGLAASWEGWQQLSTGAWVSSTHRLWWFDLALTDLRAAPRLEQLPGLAGADPFQRCAVLR